VADAGLTDSASLTVRMLQEKTCDFEASLSTMQQHATAATHGRPSTTLNPLFTDWHLVLSTNIWKRKVCYTVALSPYPLLLTGTKSPYMGKTFNIKAPPTRKHQHDPDPHTSHTNCTQAVCWCSQTLTFAAAAALLLLTLTSRGRSRGTGAHSLPCPC